VTSRLPTLRERVKLDFVAVNGRKFRRRFGSRSHLQ